MLAATGMKYREHSAPGIAEHTGAGVYYGAATTEAPAFCGRRVMVVGGGNSAGQAAMHLSRYAKEVQIVVRRDSLRDDDVALPDRADRKTPNIQVRGGTELERVEGDGHVERVTLRRVKMARRDIEEVDAVFVFIGTQAAEATGCPRACCAMAKASSSPDGICRPMQPTPPLEGEARTMALETSAPGVFAAGDIRAGAMNRVASAVGEGSMVVRFVHEYLGLT